MLIVDETADEKSSADCAGAARQYSGTVVLLACLYLAVAVALQRQHDASGPDTGLIPATIPELLRLLRDTVIPPPRRDRPHRLHWSDWRRRHQHRARQSHQRWNAYAEMTP